MHVCGTKAHGMLCTGQLNVRAITPSCCKKLSRRSWSLNKVPNINFMSRGSSICSFLARGALRVGVRLSGSKPVRARLLRGVWGAAIMKFFGDWFVFIHIKGQFGHINFEKQEDRAGRINSFHDIAVALGASLATFAILVVQDELIFERNDQPAVEQ